MGAKSRPRVSPLAGLHDSVSNGVDASVRVLGRRGDDWIQARRSSFRDVLPQLCDRTREFPVRNGISLRDNRLEGELKPSGGLYALVERL